MNDFLFDIAEFGASSAAGASITVPYFRAAELASAAVKRWGSSEDRAIAAMLPAGVEVVTGDGVRRLVVAVFGPFGAEGRRFWNILFREVDGEAGYHSLTGVRFADGEFITVEDTTQFTFVDSIPRRGEEVGVVTVKFESTVGTLVHIGDFVLSKWLSRGDGRMMVIGRRGNWLLLEDECGAEVVRHVSSIAKRMVIADDLHLEVHRLRDDLLNLPVVSRLRDADFANRYAQLTSILAQASITKGEWQTLHDIIPQHDCERSVEFCRAMASRFEFTCERDGERITVELYGSDFRVIVDGRTGTWRSYLEFNSDFTVTERRTEAVFNWYDHSTKPRTSGGPIISGQGYTRKTKKEDRMQLIARVRDAIDSLMVFPAVAGTPSRVVVLEAIRAEVLGDSGSLSIQSITDLREQIHSVGVDAGRSCIERIIKICIESASSITTVNAEYYAAELAQAVDITAYQDSILARQLLDCLRGMVTIEEVGTNAWVARWEGGHDGFYGAVSSTGFYSCCGDHQVSAQEKYATMIEEFATKKRQTGRDRPAVLPLKFKAGLSNDLDHTLDNDLIHAINYLCMVEREVDAVNRAAEFLASASDSDCECAFHHWMELRTYTGRIPIHRGVPQAADYLCDALGQIVERHMATSCGGSVSINHSNPRGGMIINSEHLYINPGACRSLAHLREVVTAVIAALHTGGPDAAYATFTTMVPPEIGNTTVPEATSDSELLELDETDPSSNEDEMDPSSDEE